MPRRPASCHPDRPHQARDLCKPCYNRQWRKENLASHLATNRRWREANPGYMRAYASTNKDRLRAHRRRYDDALRVFLAAAKAAPCQDCGVEYPPYVMDFDHRDPSSKRANVSRLNHIAAVKAEIAKCDLVCANCHRERTHGVPAPAARVS